MARLLNEPRRSVDACLDNAGEGFWVCEASTISSGLPTLRALAYSRHDDAAHEVCYPNWLAWVLKSRFFEKSESSGLVPKWAILPLTKHYASSDAANHLFTLFSGVA